jgi:hypothetical protein
MRPHPRIAVPALAASLAIALALAASAQAAPNHPPLADPLGGFALNHACGTAVDSHRDLRRPRCARPLNFWRTRGRLANERLHQLEYTTSRLGPIG